MFIKTKAAVVTALFLSYGAQADTILNVATAGDQNMVDYVKTWLGPKFEAAHPGVKVQVVGTGPGDAGSNKIIEKLTAQKERATRKPGILMWRSFTKKPVANWWKRGCLRNTVSRSAPAAW